MSFDNSAKIWDTEERKNRAEIVANEIINSIKINDNMSAMEYGCGTGLVSFNIYDKFSKVTLLDASKGMIEVLNTKIEKNHVKNMITKNIDILQETLNDEKFDLIYNSMVLHHIVDTESIVNEFYKLLNSNGYLCIVDLDEEDGSFHKNEINFNGHNGFKQKDLNNILEITGFKEIKSRTFYYDVKEINRENVKYSLFIITGRK